jgi:hypothetical protein
MMMMEALAARLREPPFDDMPVEYVDLRFSPPAMRILVRELDQANYLICSAGGNDFIAENITGEHGFVFSVDKHLPGKSFVVRLRK